MKIAVLSALSALIAPLFAESLIIGIDQKAFSKAGHKGFVFTEPGKDAVLIFDIGSDPAKPKLTDRVVIMNSVFGPPTNVALSPDGTEALVANSVLWPKQDGAYGPAPDTTVTSFKLKNGKVTSLSSIGHTGKQPSGLSYSSDGQWAAVANRNSGSVSLYRVTPSKLTLSDTVSLGGQVSAVAFTPDASALIATQFDQHSAVHLNITKGKLIKPTTLPVGRWPYNVQISADGRYALTANNGNSGLPDGHSDTVSVIGLKSSPVRVTDHITVGDGPEGLVISPNSDIAVVPLLQGSAPMFEGQWFYNAQGALAILKLGKDKVSLVDLVPTGKFPEGVAFNKAGTHVYVGDHADQAMTVFKVTGDTLKKVNHIPLEGYPASLRSQLP